MIQKKNGEQIFEYKFPGFIRENNFVGDSPDDYEILQFIGGGGFSRVLKVKSKNNLGIYAMKIVDMKKILTEKKLPQKYFENEVMILKKLDNFNVCKCHNIFQCENYLYFIMEYMNNGDLNKFNEANKSLNIQIPEDKLWDIFHKCLNGLNYIHKQGLIHRDIKLENLFLDDDLNIKIGDFNVSVAVNEKSASNFVEEEKDKVENMMNKFTYVGTPGYSAPEIKKKSYSQKIDIYSMGTAFFELCYGCKPYINIYGKDSFYQKNIYSKELNSLIDDMIQKDENKRIDSYKAYNIAKKYFIKKFVKNSAIEAVLKCFYNFPNFKNYFCQNNTIFFLTEHKREIGTSVFNVIQAIKENKREDIEDSLYELRKSLTNKGLNVKKENIEIDPGQLISFFLKKLNSELNEIISTQQNNNNQYLFIGDSSYRFMQGKEEEVFNQLIYLYNSRLSSLISKNFLSVLKTKKQCNKCGEIGLYYSMLHFIPFNVDLFSKKCSSLTIEDAFFCLSGDEINLDVDKKISCQKCNACTPHIESKVFYHTAKNLIIVLDRGENYKNDMFIDFSEILTLQKSEVERYQQVKYQLMGIISKIEDKDNKIEFISYLNKGNNQWAASGRDNEKIMSLGEVKKQGIVVSLFYYCYDNNMIFQSQNLYFTNPNMQFFNPNNQINNNNEMNNNFLNSNTQELNQGHFQPISGEINVSPMINSMPMINQMSLNNNNNGIGVLPMIQSTNINNNIFWQMGNSNNNFYYPQGNMNNNLNNNKNNVYY